VNNRVADSCDHMNKVNQSINGNTKGCEECEKIGSDWVHLRLCLSCGHVGCLSLVKNGNGVMSMMFSLDRDSDTIPSKQKKI